MHLRFSKFLGKLEIKYMPTKGTLKKKKKKKNQQSLYKEVDKSYTGFNLKTMLDCALIGACAMIRLNG